MAGLGLVLAGLVLLFARPRLRVGVRRAVGAQPVRRPAGAVGRCGRRVVSRRQPLGANRFARRRVHPADGDPVGRQGPRRGRDGHRPEAAGPIPARSGVRPLDHLRARPPACHADSGCVHRFHVNAGCLHHIDDRPRRFEPQSLQPGDPGPDLLLQNGETTPLGPATATLEAQLLHQRQAARMHGGQLFKGSPLRPAGSSDHAESAYGFPGAALYAESVDVYQGLEGPRCRLEWFQRRVAGAIPPPLVSVRRGRSSR